MLSFDSDDSSDPGGTQNYSFDGVCFIPETAPFDVYVPQNGGNSLKRSMLFKSDTAPFQSGFRHRDEQHESNPT